MSWGVQSACPDARKKPGEFPKPYRLPHCAHGVKVEGQVVDGVEHLRKHFVRRIKVTKIGARVARTNLASTIRVEWPFVEGITGVLDVDFALRRKKQAMT